MLFQKSLAIGALVASLGLGLVTTTRSADLGAGAPTTRVTQAYDEEAYLDRFAVLLMIRSTFDVVDHDLLEDELASETRRLGADGPGDFDEATLDRNLLMEGGYYLVSLRYLTQLGGALWPDDKPESTYTNDALVTLDALEQRLVDAVASREDPLPIFEDAQRLLTLTEGLIEVEPENDRFADRDALVDRVLAEFGPRSST